MTRTGPQFPPRIQIQTHNLCNYACGMCPYPEASTDRTAAQMDEAVYERILDEIAASGETVKLCLMLQNEPMLDRRFASFVAKAHAVPNIDAIATVTNGSRLDHATLDALAEFPRFHLTVSVNATDERRYLQVHGRNKFAAVTGVLRSWTGDRSRVTVSCVVGADAVEEGNRFVRAWTELGYGVRLIPYSTRAGTRDSSRVLQQVDEAFGHCSYPVETLTVRWDGSVLLCCQDWAHDETFGSLATASIAQVWNSSPMQRLRQAALQGTLRERSACAGCDYPMRSSERIALDHRLHGQSPRVPTTATHPHRSMLRNAAGETCALAVYRIEGETGTIRGVIPAGATVPRGDVEAWLCIGHRGEFVVDRPGEVWCSATIDVDPNARDEMHPVRVTLDQSHAAYDYFTWYANDWRNA